MTTFEKFIYVKLFPLFHFDTYLYPFLVRESFTVTGWINVHWIWNDDVCPKQLRDFQDSDESNQGEGRNAIAMYQNAKGEEVVKVLNLLESDFTYYLPVWTVILNHMEITTKRLAHFYKS